MVNHGKTTIFCTVEICLIMFSMLKPPFFVRLKCLRILFIFMFYTSSTMFFCSFPWVFHGVPMVFPCFPMGSPWFSHGFPWFSHVFPWFSHGFPPAPGGRHLHRGSQSDAGRSQWLHGDLERRSLGS